MRSFGYEILVTPALYLASAISILTVLFRGSGRNPVPDGDGGFTKGRFTLKPGAKRRAGTATLIAVLVLPALVITPPGHRAAIFDLGGGVSPVERGEGLSLVVPWFQTPRMVNVRTQIYSVEVYPQSLDLQEVTVPVAVNWHVQPDQAAELYQAVGLDYARTVIAPAVLQLVTQEVGQFKAIDFAQSRAALAEAVHKALQDRLGHYGIQVESVNVEDAIFAANFIQAVEAKVIADQKAAEAKRLIEVAAAEAQAVRERAAGDRDAAIFKAEGQRQAIEDVSAALGFTPQEYLRWVMLSAWDGLLPSTLVGDAGEFNLLIAPDLPVAP
jgi:regulator of protease activity HflC (stomatin/prohibitin superfamily)